MNYVRSGKGPYFLELKTYRVKGHFVGNPEKYRTREEVMNHFLHDDPIRNFRRRVTNEQWMSEEELNDMDEYARKYVEEAVKEAEAAPVPDEGELFADYYIDR